jgi:hypothetical protein
MEDVVDYEALPEHYGRGTHMLAGALAGLAEHAIIFPVDTIKVCQYLQHTRHHIAILRRIDAYRYFLYLGAAFKNRVMFVVVARRARMYCMHRPGCKCCRCRQPRWKWAEVLRVWCDCGTRMCHSAK